MVAGDVCWEFLVTMEPFCRLLGTSVRQKNPFVLVTLLSQMFSSHVCLLYGGGCFLSARLKVSTHPTVLSVAEKMIRVLEIF